MKTNQVGNKMWNPLHSEWEKNKNSLEWLTRKRNCEMYSFAIPNENAIRTIVNVANGRGIVEIGAGTGYWAKLITDNGGDVVAYDAMPPNSTLNPYHGHTEVFFDVKVGGPEKATLHSDRVLFLCWPPFQTSFASDCLNKYRGDTIIYVGEGYGGCTGDNLFHNSLTQWRKINTINIPTWYGIHDSLEVFQR